MVAGLMNYQIVALKKVEQFSYNAENALKKTPFLNLLTIISLPWYLKETAQNCVISHKSFKDDRC